MSSTFKDELQRRFDKMTFVVATSKLEQLPHWVKDWRSSLTIALAHSDTQDWLQFHHNPSPSSDVAVSVAVTRSRRPLLFWSS